MSRIYDKRPTKTTKLREMTDTSFRRHEETLRNDEAKFIIFPKTQPLEALMSRIYNDRLSKTTKLRQMIDSSSGRYEQAQTKSNLSFSLRLGP